MPRRPATPARDPAMPMRQGLYDPSMEKDSCGVGFVADMKNRKSHAIVAQGLQILHNIDHRGAVGADPKLGDGCGILTQIPHRFFSEECARLGIALPEVGHYAIGQFFMPQEAQDRAVGEEIVAQAVTEEGLIFLGWRDVPVDNSDLGQAVLETEPAPPPALRRPPGRGCERGGFRAQGSMSSASPSPTRSISGRTGRPRPITRSRCRRAPSSTRAWCW